MFCATDAIVSYYNFLFLFIVIILLHKFYIHTYCHGYLHVSSTTLKFANILDESSYKL